MDELIVLDGLDTSSLFFDDEEQIDVLLARIEKEAKSLVPDVSTAKGRKEIISLASKVTKCKTYLDGAGKDIVDDLKKQPKIIDGKRKKMREFLDGLKDEVRKPVTEWEEAEQNRIDFHRQQISSTVALGEISRQNWNDMSLDSLAKNLESLEAITIDESSEEFEDEASEAHEKAISDVEYAISMRKAEDERNAELEELRALKAEREAADNAERVRKEAEENARKVVEREKQAAIDAKEAAEKRAIQAEEDKKREIAEAEARIIREAEEKAHIEAVELKAREADKEHRSRIDEGAFDAFKAVGLTDKSAQRAVDAISKGMIPNVKVEY